MGRSSKGHARKMVAPVVVTVLVVLYYVVYFALIARYVGGVLGVVLGVVPLGLAAAMVYVCVERIGEIRKGEEDDLGQY
jgi:protein-S-isoprenylcysteine O-methyltransferase Ste14